MLNVINKKADLNNFKDHERENILWFPTIPLAKGYYSDTGYRFRKNIFEGLDNWAPFLHGYTKMFYDM